MQGPYEHNIFDIGGVIAGLNSEKFYRENGLSLYRAFEKANLFHPLEKGPFHDWFSKLARHPDKYVTSVCTLRGGWPAFWSLYDIVQKDVGINRGLHAISGRDKEPFLSILKSSYQLPTRFYDDRREYVLQAGKVGIFAGQVIHPDDQTTQNQ